MRKSAIALAAAALFGAVSIASAADVTGTIKSIDMTAKTVTLDNGQTFTLGSSVQASNFKAGDKVKVTYSGSGTTMMASDIQKAS